MSKKILSIIILLSFFVFLPSCSSDDDVSSVSTDSWNGTYVWQDEETEEFKIVDVSAVDETTVNFVLESSRTTEEFDAGVKSNSGRYLVTNLGSKTVKITLSKDGEVVTIDDMWTDDISLREENWTGKYYRLEQGSKTDKFGDKAWNGVYVCDENGMEISAYGIKEGLVLFSYDAVEDGEEVTYNFRCLEPEKSKAVYTQDKRLILLEIISSGTIKVTDLYMDDEQNKGISGVYKRK